MHPRDAEPQRWDRAVGVASMLPGVSDKVCAAAAQTHVYGRAVCDTPKNSSWDAPQQTPWGQPP
jgi:hypothetical protein